MSTPAFASSPRPGFVPALDGVRGLAVLVVIIHNSGWVAAESTQPLVKLFSAVAAMGWTGVELFFALSGYLITGILLDTRGRAGYFRSFFVRALRIFPLYYALLAVTVFVAAPLAWDPAWTAEVRAHHWPHWVYLQNWTEPFQVAMHGFTHLWSLAVEEQFYLVWPLAAWWLGARPLALLSAALVLSAPFIRAGLLAAGLPTLAAYMFTVSRWDALAVGALLAALLRDPAGRALVTRWAPRATMVVAVALALLVVRQRGFHSEEWPVLVVGQSLVSLLAAGLLAAVVADAPVRQAWLERALSAGWLRDLGRYSYAMYLFHFPLHHALKPVLTPWITATDDVWRLARVLTHVGTVLVLTYLAARLSWRVLEAPLLALKDRWAPSPVHSDQAAVGGREDALVGLFPALPREPDVEGAPERLPHPGAGEAVVAVGHVRH
jgi:peptidoglycan/LPS O-acetylase OafA/YrhL